MSMHLNKKREPSQQEAWEQALRDKQERLLELRDENTHLKEQLEEYRTMERQIASALIDAKAQAARILQNAQTQAAEEMARARAEALRVRQQAARQEKALEKLQAEARVLAGETLEGVQPLIQSVHPLAEEKAAI